MSPPKLSSYGGGGCVSVCIDQLLPQTRLVCGKSVLCTILGQVRLGLETVCERDKAQSCRQKTRPNCLVRLGCSSEGFAENDILRRKCIQRQLPGSTSTIRGILVKNTLDYIGALGLYANVCLFKSDTKCCGHNAQVSCMKGRSKGCMLEIGIRGAKMPAFSATTSVCQVIVGLVHRQGIPGSGYSQWSRLSFMLP